MSKGNALNGKLVVLMGGTGFLGNYVAQSLLQQGARLRIASRNPEHAWKLKPLANLGQLQFARVDANDRAAVERVIAGADAVVNLVGSFEGDMQLLMGEAPGWMAEAARNTGAQAFVHVSAIADAGDEDSPIAYGVAKQLGEERVRAAFPSATILRPSVMFGEDDNFVQKFAGLIAGSPVMPVFGPEAKLQPVFVDDVADAVALTLGDPGRFGGKTFELAGPEVITMMELNERIAAAQHRDRAMVAVPDVLSGLLAALPLTPMNRDQWRMLQAGHVASGDAPGLSALGIEGKPLGLFLDRWMVRYRKHGRFTDRVSV